MAGLDKITLKLDGIGHALADTNLGVPPYQRSYAWGQKNILELFSDISTAMTRKDSEYFLGSIVVTKGTDPRAAVVDGQQRLATTSALLAAIRDYFFAVKDTGRVESIETTYLLNRDLRTQEIVAKMQLNETDNDFFQKRILSRPDDPARKIQVSRESHERIEEAATIAAKFVKELAGRTKTPGDYLIDWIEYLTAKVKVIWVEVPDESNAFTIFETLNDRGLDLAVSDLLKNYLFHLSGDRIKETQQRWIAMTGILEAADTESLLVTYIRHVWASKYGLIRERDLYDSIKNQVTNRQAAIDVAVELEDNAKRYSALLNPSHEIWTPYGTTTAQHISTMNLLRMTQMRPLLLAILTTFTIPEAQKSFAMIVSAMVRLLTRTVFVIRSRASFLPRMGRSRRLQAFSVTARPRSAVTT